MSTITRIKGEIENPSFPILTPNGLKPYYLGIYENRLNEKGFVLSPSQEDAIGEFLDDISQDEVVNHVRSFWPFVGSSTNKYAAKVPLIGNKEFDFDDSFADFVFSGSDIVGISSTPATSLVGLDFFDEHKMCMGASLLKTATQSSYNPQAINKIIDVGGCQYRPVQIDTQYRQALYLRRSSGGGSPTYGVFSAPSGVDMTAAGHVYEIIGLNDHSVKPYYCRYNRNAGGEKARAAGIDTTYTYYLSDNDHINNPFTTCSYSYINAITGLFVFDKILTTSEMDAFIDALVKMNTALGRNV